MTKVFQKLARHPAFVAVLFYLIITPLYTRHAFDFSAFASRLQARDSVLSANIMRHVAQALTGQTDRALFDFGIFYPTRDTLCLSDPMMLASVTFAPLLVTPLWPLAYNLYVLACYLVGALATFALARTLGAGLLLALWCGFFATFSTDRLLHIIGHAHLLYHASFALLPLAVLRMLRPTAEGRFHRHWSVLAVVAIATQTLAGFYMLAIAAQWWLFVIPACIVASRTQMRGHWSRAVRAHAPILAVGAVLVLAYVLPVAARYAAFGKAFPQNTLETISYFSATPAGYLLPSKYGDDCAVALAHAAKSTFPKFILDRGENAQFIGIAGYLAIAVILFALGRAVVSQFLRARCPAPPIAPRPIAIALALAGITALVLSFGPYPNNTGTASTRLPFAYLYAHIESLRFMRGPARFAFNVQFALALGAVLAVAALARATSRPLFILSRGVTIALLACSLLETLPMGKLHRIPVAADDFTQQLADTGFRSPLVELTTPEDNSSMVRHGYRASPQVGGYSGYEPINYAQEMDYFRSNFPTSWTLAQMRQWGVGHAFVSQYMPPDIAAAAQQSLQLKPLWQGFNGQFYELNPSAPTLQTLRPKPSASARKHVFFSDIGEDLTPTRQFAKFNHYGTQREAENAFRTISPSMALEVTFPSAPMQAADISTLSLTMSAEHWYPLNEEGALYWSTAKDNEFRESQSLRFFIPSRCTAPASPQPINIALHDNIPWLASETITGLRLVVTRRTGVVIRIHRLALLPPDDSPAVP